MNARPAASPTTEYVETDIPPGMTIAEYRRHHRGARPREWPIRRLALSAVETVKRVGRGIR